MADFDPTRLELPDQLEGPRVLLRPWRESDAQGLYDAVAESMASLSEWLPWPGDYQSVADAPPTIRSMRARWLTREDLIVGIFDRASGRVLGGSGLQRINWNVRAFETGYWLRDSAVGNGYASETVQVLTKFAFEQLGANRVEIRMDPQNVRSRNIPVRLGFVYEGCLRQSALGIDRTPRDTDIFALTRDDYHRLQTQGP
jgi:ribosomal-protein-serine acetyltransferase